MWDYRACVQSPPIETEYVSVCMCCKWVLNLPFIMSQVFGDRTLAEDEVVGELMGQLVDAGSSSYPYRHIFVRLRDIEAVSLTSMHRKISFDASIDPGAALHPGVRRSLEAGSTQLRSPRSALTALIDSQPNRCASWLTHHIEAYPSRLHAPCPTLNTT